MVLDGHGVRAIGRMIGMDPSTVHDDIRAFLAEDAARRPMQAEQLREVIGARLDESRVRLVKLAQSSACTPSERIAAERTLASIEAQRADLCGVKPKGAAGELLEALAELARRSYDDRTGRDLADSDATANPLQSRTRTREDSHALPAPTTQHPDTPWDATAWSSSQQGAKSDAR